MKKHIFGLARICASVAALAMCAPAQAQTVQNNNNTIGPSVQFGGGQSNFGIDSKFGVSDLNRVNALKSYVIKNSEILMVAPLPLLAWLGEPISISPIPFN